MSPKLHEFAVVLLRDGQGTPWGIRLVGGNDLDTPLIITRVQAGSPSHGELLRGDIIAKIGEYDARDLSHADAQQLFRGAGNEIRLTVHRDNKIAYTQGVSQDAGPGSRSNSTLPPASPELLPHRGPSPFLPGPSHFERALQLPMDTLPQTVFPQLNSSGGYEVPSSVFSPKPTRDHQQDVDEEQAAIVNQPYRTTPLVLPGAKVKKDAPTTESYLRHYPNPAVRAHPGHDYHDSIMKQRVADTMLHKVVGSEADTGRVFHKQFNSPIGLYSNSNIEDTIRTTVPIFIDLSFLEQKRKILEQQKQKDRLAEQQRQHRQQQLQQLYQQNK
ncbi:PDZ and LIM domain protein 1 isoform X4 [Drosophila serrata]|uniref:PDZ and LIM domain protein 1 isoform X4 n=1 Tax=Drosophila serrata TaxID=7274 RepID=UPI000A1D02D5|nr:PDZ and LIM domain protein 1 isoform X4 [Drosophila serrata]